MLCEFGFFLKTNSKTFLCQCCWHATELRHSNLATSTPCFCCSRCCCCYPLCAFIHSSIQSYRSGTRLVCHASSLIENNKLNINNWCTLLQQRQQERQPQLQRGDNNNVAPNTLVHKAMPSIHVPAVCGCVCYLCVSMDLPFCSCRGFYWVSGCCNCNRNFKVAAAAHVAVVAIDAVVVVVSSDHFKKALHTSEGRGSIKILRPFAFAAHGTCKSMCQWLSVWVGVFAHRPTSTRLVVIASAAAAAQVELLFLLRNWKRLSAIAQGQMQVRVSVCMCLCVSECCTSMRSKCGK